MDINSLISKYFAGETTVAEESQLRQLLSDPSYDSEMVDEARATMAAIDTLGYNNPTKKIKSHNLRFNWAALARAAAVAAVITVGTIAIFRPAPDCVAYAYGHRVDSPELALQFMMNDLEAVGAAQDAVQSQIASDFSAIANALDNE